MQILASIIKLLLKIHVNCIYMVTYYLTNTIISVAVSVMWKNRNYRAKKGNRGQNSEGSKMGPEPY